MQYLKQMKYHWDGLKIFPCMILWLSRNIYRDPLTDILLVMIYFIYKRQEVKEIKYVRPQLIVGVFYFLFVYGITLFLFNYIRIDEIIQIKNDSTYIFLLCLMNSVAKPCCEELYWNIKELRDIFCFVLYQITYYQIFFHNIYLLMLVSLLTAVIGFFSSFLKQNYGPITSLFMNIGYNLTLLIFILDNC